MRSCMPIVGARLAYWIWLKLGARLSEVAWPAARIASLIVQVPVWGSIASFVYLEAGRHRRGVRVGAVAGAHSRPGFGVRAFEGVDLAPVGAAVGVPDRRVGVGAEIGRMEADSGVEIIVVAVGGVDRLRAAHLLRGFAEELERPGNAVFLHRCLGRQQPAECAAAERGMGVSVAGGVFVQPGARLPVGHALLAVAGHGVVLGIGGDGRAALA